MFAPAIKYGIRIGLIVVISVAIWAVFTQVQIPAVDFTIITQNLGTVFAVLYHFIPPMQYIIPFMIALIGIRLGLYAWKFASIAIKWIWKVNE